ncbi:hypothetical protein [Moheibacter sediminis]|uniref:hypothetical protein n=1 Tax=Moheibacter sediminis TaxID=1434700 RepID=UPI00117F97FF|nr:hypothetical protein [Moheibacter sediminis]
MTQNMQLVCVLLLMLFPVILLAETEKDSLYTEQTEQAEIKNKSATLFIVKGTLVTNLDQVKGNISINETKPSARENNYASQKASPLTKRTKKEKIPPAAEQETENTSNSQTKILPAGQNGKSLLGDYKKHAVAIAISLAKNEQRNYAYSISLNETCVSSYSLDIHRQKKNTYSSFFFFPKNELLDFSQGIRPPPTV